MGDLDKGQAPQDSGQEPEVDQQAKSDSSGQEPDEERFDANYVRKLRQENASHRTRVRELEAG